MSMVEKLSYFLKLHIKQMEEGIFINQAKYMKDLLKEYGMEGCKKISTLMATSTKLDADDSGKGVDQKLYRDMIGSLLYLTASSFRAASAAASSSRPAPFNTKNLSYLGTSFDLPLYLIRLRPTWLILP